MLKILLSLSLLISLSFATDSTTSNERITINSVNDVLGHTITSNVAHPNSTSLTTQLSIEFHCDGSFDYHMDIAYGGHHSNNIYHGTEIYVDDHFETARIGWHYEDEDGERSGDNIDTNVNNQIVEGMCWYSTRSDGSCSNNIKIESVTGSGCN